MEKRRKIENERRKMGFWKNKSGYKVFREGNRTVSVHKRVAEKKVGGPICAGYEVHHKDGNKTNNRPSNLAVLKKKRP